MARKLKSLLKNADWKKISGTILLITLILSTAYSIVKLILAPETATEANQAIRVKSDYTLMLIQCILGLLIMFLPSFLEHKFSIEIPNYMYILFFGFLYCAIYLGDVRNFYYIFPHWDTVLHTFSGGMLGALGFSLVSVLNGTKRFKLNLSPFFVALFAFCFAMAAGVVWEIHEYVWDGILGINMQRYTLPDGTLLLGRDALADTMKDLIVDALGALVISVLGFLTIKKDKLARSYEQSHQ